MPPESLDGPARWHSVRSIFEELLGLTGVERAERLAASGLDTASRSAVERMLAADAGEGPATPYSRRIGRYDVGQSLGRGGMGEVFLAYDSSLDRRVALKLLDKRLTQDARWL